MSVLTDISVSNFSRVYVLNAAGDAYTLIGNVQSIGELSDEKTIIDVQEYGVQYLRKLVGTANAGPLEVVCNSNPDDEGQTRLKELYASGARTQAVLLMTEPTLLDGQYLEFKAFIGSKSLGNDFDAGRTSTFSIAIDGTIGEEIEYAPTLAGDAPDVGTL